MGRIAQEILRILDDSIALNGPDMLNHEGKPRRSGRYPWGSGDNPYQHEDWYRTGHDWLKRVDELYKEGWTQKDIADRFEITTTDQRAMESIAKRDRKLEEGHRIKELQEKGISNIEIAKIMGLPNESSVRSKRSWYDRQMKPDTKTARTTADYLKMAIDELGGAIDVGEGVARKMNISPQRLDQALVILQNEGYSVTTGMLDRVTDPNGQHKITMKVVGKGELPQKFVRNYPEEIHSINELNKELTEDGTKIRPSFVFPESMDSKRLEIVYAEDGGKEKDGLIEIRPGVPDLSLGESTYAQVRILVDGNTYLKGMAVYNKDLPEGIDVRFNTNKTKDVPMKKVLKAVKEDPFNPGYPDPENPFGSLIKEKGGQSYYDDPNGKYIDPETGKKQSLSLINKRAEENDWGEWADKLPSQMLSKQPVSTIKRQLKFSIDEREAEYAEILSVTNPTVRKDLLMKFAASCDTNAETLKAAAFPGQKYQVIIPIKSLKDNEVYAPNYEEGTQVALIRYPHGGTFEIPILTVNNKNKEGKAYLGNTPGDAVGINSKVAERLSGADFDGDTVQVIPMTDTVTIKNSNPLPGLIGFDPKIEYAEREGMTYMKYDKIDEKTGRKKTIDNTQHEMGKISNLITDMTILGRPRSEIERAVRHSMVVIDAAKHKLDYKRSEIDNGIPELKRSVQGRKSPKSGRTITPSATIISRAGAEDSAPKTKGSGRINQKGKPWYDPSKPEGALIYKIDTYPTKAGKQRMMKTTQMANTDDAFKLVSSMENPIEVAYANYANTLKDMANKARLESATIIEKKRSPSAAKIYAEEVKSLKESLKFAQANQDVERWAQILATQRVRAKLAADPSLEDDNKMVKKIRQQTLMRARQEVGAERHEVPISPREWEAIQAGAVGNSVLSAILKYADPDKVKQLSMPRDSHGLTSSQVNIMHLMASNGFTQKQIADRFNVSASTINEYLNKKEKE